VTVMMIDNSDFLQADIDDSYKATVLNVMPEVSLEAGTATMIVGPDSGCLRLMIANLAINSQVFRIGDITVSAFTGAELKPGELIEIETTVEVYGYNPGNNPESVFVMWTEEE